MAGIGGLNAARPAAPMHQNDNWKRPIAFGHPNTCMGSDFPGQPVQAEFFDLNKNTALARHEKCRDQ